MEWLMPATMLLGVWAFLSLLGLERTRRIRELDYQIVRAQADAARAAEAAAEVAARQQAAQGR